MPANKLQLPRYRILSSFLRLLGALLIFILFVLSYALFYAHVSAHALDAKANIQPTWHINLGFNTRYRDGTWVPVRIQFSNGGPDFSGAVTITPPPPFVGTSTASSPSQYQVPVILPSGSQKQIALALPLEAGVQGTNENIVFNLLDANGRIMQTQTVVAHALGTQDILVGILSDRHTGFGPLNAASLPNQGGLLIVEDLDAATFPTTAETLNSFDLIILDDFTTSTLSREQLVALQSWVSQGGALIEIGGPDWQRTLAALPKSLLPVAVNGTDILTGKTQLLPLTDPKQGEQGRDSVTAPIPISTAVTIPQGPDDIDKTILASGTTPVIVQKQQGKGIICYLAFDPLLEPMASWPSANRLWQSLLIRTLGERLLPPNSSLPLIPSGGAGGVSIKPNTPSLNASFEGLLQALLPNTLPPPWLLFALLFSYIIVLGPLRYLIVRRTGHRYWNWRIMLSSVIIFSLLSYGLALQEKGTSIISNTISIVQFSQDGSLTHTTHYVGVFVPGQGNFQVNIPGQSLVRSLPDELTPGSPVSQRARITVGESASSANLLDVSMWTMRTVIAEQDSPANGEIRSQLTLDHNILTGSVTNTLHYGLNDAYILTGKGFVRLGHLAAGQTRQIMAPLRNQINNPGATLADQVAWDNNLSIPYSFDASNQHLNDPLQQHLAMLTALNGEASSYSCGNGSCPMKTVLASYQKTLADPILAFADGNNPLMLSQTSATLIGWADRALDEARDIMINDANYNRVQEALIQAPLHITQPGSLPVPPNSVMGQLVDVQGNSVQTQPGLYLMTTGSVTFEMTLPAMTQAEYSKNSPLVISLLPYPPYGVYQIGGTGPNTIANGQMLHVHLYNWHTHSWSSVTLNQSTFTIQDMHSYVNTDGRILFQVANQNSQNGTFVIGKPIITLQQ